MSAEAYRSAMGITMVEETAIASVNNASYNGAAVVKPQSADIGQLELIGPCWSPVIFPSSQFASIPPCPVPDISCWHGDDDADAAHAAAHEGRIAIMRESARARVRKRIQSSITASYARDSPGILVLRVPASTRHYPRRFPLEPPIYKRCTGRIGSRA